MGEQVWDWLLLNTFVSNYKGTISLKSELNVGTTIEIVFTAAKEKLVLLFFCLKSKLLGKIELGDEI